MTTHILAIFYFIMCTTLSASSPQHQAQALIDQADYSQGLSYLKTLPRASMPADVKARLSYLEGVCLVSLNRYADAQKVFVDLLTNTPDFFPDEPTSPKILDVFYRARQNYLQGPQTSWGAPDLAIREEKPGSLTFATTIPLPLQDIISRVVLHLRTIDEPYYRSYPLINLHQEPARRAIEIPSPTANVLHYYVEFYGRYNKPFIHIGSADNPFSHIQNIVISEKPKNEKLEGTSALKSGWPLMVGGAIAVMGTLVFGLLKIGPSI
jgi:hypothetical protein